MAKNTSEWIDNPKVRKELYDFNQAIKSVYTQFRYCGGIVVPLTMDSISTRPLFNESFFIRHGKHFDFLENSAVDVDELNNALKDKATNYEEKNGINYLCGKNRFEIGRKMSESQILDIKNYRGLKAFEFYYDIEPLGFYKLTEQDFEDIIEYRVTDKVIAHSYDEKPIDINMIMAKEIFPMVKRTNDISITTYYIEGLPKGVYVILICSKAETWEFYSFHKILIM